MDFSHSIIYIANKAQYIYLYTVAKSPYFCVRQQKKRTAILGRVNRLLVELFHISCKSALLLFRLLSLIPFGKNQVIIYRCS